MGIRGKARLGWDNIFWEGRKADQSNQYTQQGIFSYAEEQWEEILAVRQLGKAADSSLLQTYFGHRTATDRGSRLKAAIFEGDTVVLPFLNQIHLSWGQQEAKLWSRLCLCRSKEDQIHTSLTKAYHIPTTTEGNKNMHISEWPGNNRLSKFVSGRNNNHFPANAFS